MATYVKAHEKEARIFPQSEDFFILDVREATLAGESLEQDVSLMDALVAEAREWVTGPAAQISVLVDAEWLESYYGCSSGVSPLADVDAYVSTSLV